MSNEREVFIEQSASWQLSLEKARHFLQAKRYDLAERELKTVLTAAPTNELAHVLLGYVRLGQNQLADAESEARSALALDPESTAAKVLLGQVCDQLGKHVEAERWYLDALQADPQDALTLYFYASLLHGTGHFEKAEKLCRASLALEPDDSDTHSLLSAILNAKDQHRRATEHGHQGLSLSPESNFSHFVIGLARYNGWHPFRGRWHLREAVRLDPSNNDVVEAYHTADFGCRWTYLPLFFFNRLLEQLPGGQFTIWAVLVFGSSMLRQSPVWSPFVLPILLAWIIFCLYSWVAIPITKAWIKLVPPR